MKDTALERDTPSREIRGEEARGIVRCACSLSRSDGKLYRYNMSKKVGFNFLFFLKYKVNFLILYP